VIEHPDLTLDELRGRLAADGIQTSRSALGRFFLAHGLTRKKRPVAQNRKPGVVIHFMRNRGPFT